MRPGRDNGILADDKWDDEGHDDVDAIADSVQRGARESRVLTKKGLLDSLAHPAAYEDEAFDSIVIDSELVSRAQPGGELESPRVHWRRPHHSHLPGAPHRS